MISFGGIKKTSLIDYPGKISTVLFTQGCNFRCPWCHNASLVDPKMFGDKVNESDIIEYLESRICKVDAVVITGGEPTIHKGLIRFIRKIKGMGFDVKLDTNGSNPSVIKKVIDDRLVDYFAMDIKTVPAKYREAIGVDIDIALLKESFFLIKDSGIDHEFRTTMVHPYVCESDVGTLNRIVSGSKYFLQKYRDEFGVLCKTCEMRAAPVAIEGISVR